MPGLDQTALERDLADRYQLTPAEVRVALMLIEGLAPVEIAAGNQVSLNTIRTQIKSLLRKTDTRRQAEFIAEVYKRIVGLEA